MTLDDWKETQKENLPLARSICSSIYPYATNAGWGKKYKQKRDNAKIESIEFIITFDEFLAKVMDAGLHEPSQIGIHQHSYQLGRYGDVGPYSADNCRYITGKENRDEVNTPKSSRLAQAVKITGENHPLHKGYWNTPSGRFTTTDQAAEANGCSASTIWRRCKLELMSGYYFEDKI